MITIRYCHAVIRKNVTGKPTSKGDDLAPAVESGKPVVLSAAVPDLAVPVEYSDFAKPKR